MTLKYSPIPGAENPGNYRPQGLHPVHLGDSFADGRYTVVHKLGHGMSSTIWLVHDAKTQSYASLKIIAACRPAPVTELAVLQHLEATFDDEEEGSTHVMQMLDHFVHDGPNGRHQCIVGEVLGPSLASYIGPFWDDDILPGNMVRRLVGQIALGVKYLHKRRVAHGDLHQGNILLCPPTPAWSSQADVEAYLGAPLKRPLRVESPLSSHVPPSPHVPDYLVPDPDEVDFLQLCLTRPHVKLCDFSEAYMPDLPRAPSLAIPRIFRTPEALLDPTPGHASTETDVWALAVLMHMLFTGGRGLFYFGDDRQLREMVRLLGKFPEPWWSSWANRSRYFDDDGRLLDAECEDIYGLAKLYEEGMPVDGSEYDIFEALLRSMVRYDSDTRITADAVVASEWVQEYCRPWMGDTETFVIDFCEEYLG
ncbi:kinase-like domain-containing protein [Mycena olivaceomarginata]|nr:kinase-like domain-containing protein [Mycena olivaceomarginata]